MGQLRTGTMTTRLQLGAERPGLHLGFTLVELTVVMAIIGIILAFLLIAAGDARRRAEQDATLALITKLEGGVNDRLDALLQTRPDPNPAHFYMAGIYPADTQLPESSLHAGPGFRLVRLHQERAARRLLRAEFDRADQYPLNFACGQRRYPGARSTSRAWAISCCRSATGSRGHCLPATARGTYRTRWARASSARRTSRPRGFTRTWATCRSVMTASTMTATG